MKKRYIILIIVILVIVVGIYILRYPPISIVPFLEEIGIIKNTRLTGIIKTGEQIGTDYHLEYCREPFFLETSTGNIMLRFKDEEGNFRVYQNGEAKEEINEKYLGKKVKITGRYSNPSCLAICLCDSNITVDYIKVIK